MVRGGRAAAAARIVSSQHARPPPRSLAQCHQPLRGVPHGAALPDEGEDVGLAGGQRGVTALHRGRRQFGVQDAAAGGDGPDAVDEFLDAQHSALRERHGEDAVANLEGRAPEPRHFPTLWIYLVALVLVAAMVLFLLTQL